MESRGWHEISRGELAEATAHADLAADEAEDDEIMRALLEAEEDSHERGDTRGRLDSWRDAERAADGSDAETAEGRALLDAADDARNSFHEAEDLQRERHGEPSVNREARPSRS